MKILKGKFFNYAQLSEREKIEFSNCINGKTAEMTFNGNWIK